jgi:alpha-acetolactate decarboxylase
MKPIIHVLSMKADVLSACALLALVLAGCDADRSATKSSTKPAAPPAASPTRWFGALHAIMHEGRTETAVKLADVVAGPGTFGLGALTGLDGEVTVVDGVVWLARPRADGTAEVRRADLEGADRDQGATLFVVAGVASWREIPLARDVAWSELDAFLEAALPERGYAVDVPIALRIEGPVAGLRWHVVDGSKLEAGAGHADHARASVSGRLERVDAQLVGFFSTAHQGVFTHAGASTHFHAVIADPLTSGHVDEVTLLRGARLFVAAP